MIAAGDLVYVRENRARCGIFISLVGDYYYKIFLLKSSSIVTYFWCDIYEFND